MASDRVVRAGEAVDDEAVYALHARRLVSLTTALAGPAARRGRRVGRRRSRARLARLGGRDRPGRLYLTRAVVNEVPVAPGPPCGTRRASGGWRLGPPSSTPIRCHRDHGCARRAAGASASGRVPHLLGRHDPGRRGRGARHQRGLGPPAPGPGPAHASGGRCDERRALHRRRPPRRAPPRPGLAALVAEAPEPPPLPAPGAPRSTDRRLLALAAVLVLVAAVAVGIATTRDERDADTVDTGPRASLVGRTWHLVSASTPDGPRTEPPTGIDLTFRVRCDGGRCEAVVHTGCNRASGEVAVTRGTSRR